jgi:hypothetical protein
MGYVEAGRHSDRGGVFILLWSDEHEKTEEKTKREIEPTRTDRIDGGSQRYVQASAWGD